MRLVDSYVHLGHLVTFSGGCLEDIKERLHSANLVFRRLRATLLRNQELTIAERTYLVRSLVHSKLGYGAGLWVAQAKAEREAFQHAFMTHWRQACKILSGVGSKFLKDSEICAIIGVAEPSVIGQAAVLRQLKVVLAHGPGFLWEAIEAEKSWLQQAVEAIRQATRRLGVQGPPLCDKTALCDLLPWQRRLPVWARRVTAAAAQHSATDGPLALRKAQMLQKFERLGGVQIPIPTVGEGGQWSCTECGKSCSTKAALAVHRSIVHGDRASSFMAAGTTCAVCLTQWWTTARLRQHVWRSEVCSQAYQHADLNEPQSFEIVGSRRDLAWKPPVPVYGPHDWWTTLRPTGNVRREEAAAAEAEGYDKLLLRLGVGSFELWVKAAVDWVVKTPNCTDFFPTLPEHRWAQVLPILSQLKERRFQSAGIEDADWLAAGDGKYLWLASATERP